MTPHSVEIVFTEEFDRQAKRAKVPPDVIREIIVTLKARPDSGVVVPGTGGARKVRFAGRGKGKSGGYRVITCFLLSDTKSEVYLFDIYAKSDRVDMGQGERNRLRRIVDLIKESVENS